MCSNRRIRRIETGIAGWTSKRDIGQNGKYHNGRDEVPHGISTHKSCKTFASVLFLMIRAIGIAVAVAVAVAVFVAVVAAVVWVASMTQRKPAELSDSLASVPRGFHGQ